MLGLSTRTFMWPCDSGASLPAGTNPFHDADGLHWLHVCDSDLPSQHWHRRLVQVNKLNIQLFNENSGPNNVTIMTRGLHRCCLITCYHIMSSPMD